MKPFSCLSQLGMKFQRLKITTCKCLKIKTFLAFKLSDVVFIVLINVKMPTIVGILTYMSIVVPKFDFTTWQDMFQKG